jgi:branched-chain amino acid transport system substrate-binding protein
MRNLRLSCVLVLALILSACVAQSPGNAETTKPAIAISSDLPTSGQDSQGGQSAQQAIQFAVDQTRAVKGFPVRLVPFDDSAAGRGSAEKGAQNVQQMIDDPKVLGMVGPYSSNVAFAEIPVANRGGLAMISPSTTVECLTQAYPYCNPPPNALRPSGKNNFFRVAAPDPLQGPGMAEFTLDTLKVNRVAVFSEGSMFGSLMADNFTKDFTKGGGTIVLRQDLAETTNDFTPFLSAARDRSAQAIYAGGGQATGICRARAQMKRIFSGDVFFLGNDEIVDSQCVSDAAENANEGMYATVAQADVSLSSDTRVQNIVAAYRKAHPMPGDIMPYTFAAYDAAIVLLDAISRAVDGNGGKVPSRQQVVDAIAKTRGFRGVTGTFSFDSKGDATAPPMTIYQVRNGRWVAVRSVEVRSTPLSS